VFRRGLFVVFESTVGLKYLGSSVRMMDLGFYYRLQIITENTIPDLVSFCLRQLFITGDVRQWLYFLDKWLLDFLIF
jgi:hypothetical protein